MLVFTFHHVESEIYGIARKTRSITPAGLRAIIKTARFLGFNIISLKDFFELKHKSYIQTRKCILFTFDDGYKNFYLHAAPILIEEKCPATVFVLAEKFSGYNDWDSNGTSPMPQDELMSLEEMKTLSSTGLISFGSHGLLHKDLSLLNGDDCFNEIHVSYKILTKALENAFFPVFAYPWGRYSVDAIKYLEISQYKFAFTTEQNLWPKSIQPYKIPRYNILYKDRIIFIFILRFIKTALISFIKHKLLFH